MADRYPFQQHSLPQHVTVPISSQRSNILSCQVMPSWQQQQKKVLEDQKMREYHRQQQKLRLMGLSTNKAVSADKLIENLLEKKETFQLKNNTSASSSQMGVQATAPVSTPSPNVASIVGSVPSGYLSNQCLAFGSGAGHAEGQLSSWLVRNSPSLPTLYRQVWSLVAGPNGLADTTRLFSLLLTSGLSSDILGHIWALANREVPGLLTETELYAVLALVALAQGGCAITSLNILNLLPQPPIPNLNIASISASPAAVSFHPPESQIKMKREELNLKLSSDDITPAAEKFNKASVAEDLNTEFTDFQSCSVSATDSIAHSNQPKNDHMVPSTSTASYRCISHYQSDSLAEKCPNVVVVGGTSLSRGIGSRLANHSLGAPKQSKTRHHKHLHHHHNRPSPQAHSVPSTPDDDFADFQQADSLSPSMLSDADTDTFTKCIPRTSMGSTYMLKESAIRTDMNHLSLEECSEKVVNVTRDICVKSNGESEKSSKDQGLLEPSDSHHISVGCEKNPTTLRVPTNDSNDDLHRNQNYKIIDSKELMVVEEDKYSALRQLSVLNEGIGHVEKNDHSEQSDDFGDFISAELSEDDPFADISTRDTTSVIKKSLPIDEQAKEPQESEFFVDWSTFQKSADVESTLSTSDAASGITVSPISNTYDSNADNKETANSTCKNSFTLMTPQLNETSLSSLQTLDLNISSSVNKNGIITNLQESSPSIDTFPLGNLSSQPNCSYRVRNVDLDLQQDVFSFSPEQHVAKSLFIPDDEYGDFIGPESSTEDADRNKIKEFVIDNQLIISNKDITSDSQSVSSLEFPALNLSRQGSLPSLDLKVFPSSSEQPGTYRSWSTSPQGVEHQMAEWCRCVQSCSNLLQAAVNLFSSVPSEEVLGEVLSVNEARDYLHNLLEVYGVCQRVKQAFKLQSSESKKLESLLIEADNIWSGLKTYYSKADIMAQLEMPPAEVGDAGVCGICLTRLEGGGNTSPLEYGGQLYHAACANLWVNCVDCSLPSFNSSVLCSQ